MTGAAAGREQLELLRSAVRGRRPTPPEPLAAQDPVAAVVLDVPLPHLDRAFDYAVPASMSAAARPGARVRVRFAGQEVGGFVVARRPASEHVGPLTPVRRSVSGEPVLDPDVLRAARAVAQETAGTLADVLRLAVPPRHAAAESRAGTPLPPPPDRPAAGPWASYPGGTAFLDRIAAGGDPRAVWTALPGAGDDGWPAALAVAALAAAAADRGVLAVLPDHRDVDRVVSALTARGAAEQVVRLTADAGPARRYTAFLRALRGQARIVVGTRAAALAPVRNLGLVVCWDDGDDAHAEPRAPYPHARDVLRVRADQTGAAAVLGSHSRSVEAQLLLRRGWARPLVAGRALVRERAPRVVVSGDDELRDPAARTARLPSLALRAAREALGTRAGPVLVQVPRAGYVPVLSCQTCRAAAGCGACHGPLAARSAAAAPSCGWCGRPAVDWSCRACGSVRLRSARVGVDRTAEELGRALPGVPVRVSGGAAGVLPDVGAEPALVLATPGAEPWAEGGYAAALLLDGWSLLARADLRSGEEALRRWTAAAALVGPQGEVVLVAEASHPAVQALVRWDGAGLAARELEERTQLRLPPAALLAEAVGSAAAVDAFRVALQLPAAAEVLGPVAVEPAPGPPPGAVDPEPQVRLLVRSGLDDEGAVVAALTAARRSLSAAKVPRPPRVRVRPAVIG